MFDDHSINPHLVEIAREQLPVESPRPLQRTLAPGPEYPIDALGDLADVAHRIHEVVQAPEPLIGNAILAAITLAVQPFAKVRIDGREIPLSGYYVSVAESGERKSAVDRLVLQAHYDHQRDLVDDYRRNFGLFTDELLAFEQQRKLDLAQAKTFSDKKEALAALGTPPAEPGYPHFIINEPTYEGLIKTLAGWPSLGVFSDEGGRLVGGHAMSKENQLKTCAALSELWDGKDISRVRAGDGSSLLCGRVVSLHLMLQPSVAMELLTNPVAQGQGIFSRCLLTFPDSTIGSRRYKDVDLSADPVMQRYYGRIAAILNEPWPYRVGADGAEIPGQLDPRLVHLSGDAKAVWVVHYNQTENECGKGGALESVKAFASKAAEHALRLAGILTLYHDLGARQIDAATMKNAWEMVHFFLHEALRMAERGTVDPDLDIAQQVLDWSREYAEGTPKQIALVEIYTNGIRSVRDSKTARRIAGILEDNGWFRKLPVGTKVRGKVREEVWEILDEDVQSTESA